MLKSLLCIVLAVASGLSLAQMPMLPSSFSEQEIRDGARAFEKLASGKPLTGQEAIKAAEFAGYVGGHIDAKTGGPNPEPTLAECLRAKSRALIVRRTASLLVDPNNQPVNSVRFEVGFAAIMACKDEYWVAKTTGAATPQWSKFGENARLTAYVQRDSAPASGLSNFWVLYDYKTEQRSERSAKRYLSEKARQEVDCAQARSRTTFFTWHQANMAEGQVVYTGRTSLPWEPHAPGSIGATLAAVVCGK
jgi:hypothetical protein